MKFYLTQSLRLTVGSMVTTNGKTNLRFGCRSLLPRPNQRANESEPTLSQTPIRTCLTGYLRSAYGMLGHCRCRTVTLKSHPCLLKEVIWQTSTLQFGIGLAQFDLVAKRYKDGGLLRLCGILVGILFFLFPNWRVR